DGITPRLFFYDQGKAWIMKSSRGDATASNPGSRAADSIVVPAKAGTHNHRQLLCAHSWCESLQHLVLWLWVPGLAALARDDSNSHRQHVIVDLGDGVDAAQAH